jgi:hypothetical protein
MIHKEYRVICTLQDSVKVVLLQEQPVVVLLLNRALTTWSLAMDERGGHEDLRGSSH